MLKRTHQEGGKTAIILTGIVAYCTYPFLKVDYALLTLCMIVITNVCVFASTCLDLDHSEDCMPTRGAFSHIMHAVIHKLDPEHRSIVSHSIFFPLLLNLLPAFIIFKTDFKLMGYYSVMPINYLLYCVLLSMFFGSVMHLILDLYTVSGIYKLFAPLKLIYYKIKRKNIDSMRHKQKIQLVSKNHSLVLTFAFPFVKKVEVKDYGKTGGQYEAIFRINLITFNYFLLSVMMFIAVQPDYDRFIKIIHHTCNNLFQ